jgi:hypothetical protein
VKTGLIRGCLLFALGCGSRSAPDPVVTPTYTPSAPSEALRTSLLRRLESTVLENYDHVNLNNVDAYLNSMATDRPLLLIGPTASEFYLGPRARTMPFPSLTIGKSADLLSKNLSARVSLSGEVGWV